MTAEQTTAADTTTAQGRSTVQVVLQTPIVRNGETVTTLRLMKPRTGDGPMEVTKEGRGIVMRVPVDGGGRLVVEMNAVEATDLLNALQEVVG